MKRFWWIFIVILLLGCTRDSIELPRERIDRVVMMMPDEKGTQTPNIKEIRTEFYLRTLLEIFEQATLEQRLRDDELMLSQSAYFIFYDGEEVVGTLIFNGADCKRLWYHWGWYEVSYEGVSPADFYGLYEQEAKVGFSESIDANHDEEYWLLNVKKRP